MQERKVTAGRNVLVQKTGWDQEHNCLSIVNSIEGRERMPTDTGGCVGCHHSMWRHFWWGFLLGVLRSGEVRNWRRETSEWVVYRNINTAQRLSLLASRDQELKWDFLVWLCFPPTLLGYPGVGADVGFAWWVWGRSVIFFLQRTEPPSPYSTSWSEATLSITPTKWKSCSGIPAPRSTQSSPSRSFGCEYLFLWTTDPC